MKNYNQLDKTEKLIFALNDSLKEDIGKKVISEGSINKLSDLSKDFVSIGEDFFQEFMEDTANQLITYGSAITSSEICTLLKNNLSAAKSLGQNPIAAERIMSRNYLMYLHFIVDSFRDIAKKKELSSNELRTLNESVRTLIRLTEEDGIYTEPKIEFKNEQSREILSSVSRDIILGL